MIKAERLDATQIPGRIRHTTIFEHFEALEAGEGFILENDHDPMPLYYQLLQLYENVFNWEYIEKGPDWFQIRISKHDAII